MNATLAPLRRLPARQPLLFLLLAAAAWFGLYHILNPAAEALVAALPVERDSHLGGALQFFLYDTPKVLLLLTGIVFVMGMINSYFTPERTRALLAKGAALGTVLAFMMSVIALSFPEMVILRKVLKMRLIVIFVAVVASGILLVGFVFNAVL